MERIDYIRWSLFILCGVSMTKKYDLVIIGGGAAGFSALVKYSETTTGKVAMVNKGPLGGTCVNVGCVPSKRLIEWGKRSKLINTLKQDNQYEMFRISSVLEDIRNLRDGMRKAKYEDIISYYDVDLYNGYASFGSDGILTIKNSREKHEITGDKYIIATGSSPVIPPIDGLDKVEYHTSNDIWDVREDFGSILIIGAGAIGLEFAQAFNRLGIETYIVEVMDRVIPSTEPELSEMLTARLRDEGVNIFLKSRVSKISKVDGSINVEVIGHYGKKNISVDKLMVATGRKPNTEGLGLENIGVDLDGRGRIVVNRNLRTSNPNIYAAGDVSSTWKPAILETISAREGAIAALNIIEEDKYSVDHSYVPVTVFTDPELSYVGMRESDVIKSYGGCKCRLVTFKSLAKSGIIDEDDGAAKIVVDPNTGVIKGIHIYAPNSSEYIMAASLILRHGYRIEDVIEMPTVFPSGAEIIKLAAQAFIRNIGRMPCCVE